MIRARVTISQKVKIVRTVEVESDSYDNLYRDARNEFGLCLIDEYDDFDDFNLENIEVLEENAESEEDE